MLMIVMCVYVGILARGNYLGDCCAWVPRRRGLLANIVISLQLVLANGKSRLILANTTP